MKRRQALRPPQTKQRSKVQRSRAPRKKPQPLRPNRRWPNREWLNSYCPRYRLVLLLFPGRPSLGAAAVATAGTSWLTVTDAVGTVAAAKFSSHVWILQGKTNQGKYRVPIVSVVTIGQRFDDRTLVIRIAGLACSCELGKGLSHGGEPSDPPINFFQFC